MPIQFQLVSKDEADRLFARRSVAQEDLKEYVDLLKSQIHGLGETFKIRTTDVERRGEIRRFNAAAKTLGYFVRWRQRDGWLAGQTVASLVKTTRGPLSPETKAKRAATRAANKAAKEKAKAGK